jgi:hypothetical protein
MNYEDQNSILPLSFPVSVVGIPMTATVVKDLSDHSCYKYRVRFENGIEEVFTLIEGPETIVQASDASNEHYAQALQHDLYELSKVVPENFLFILNVKLHGEPTNLWLVEEEPDPGEDKAVMVNYNSNFGFQLYCAHEKWGVREYKPTPLTAEEKEMAKGLLEPLQMMFDPAALANLLASR